MRAAPVKLSIHSQVLFTTLAFKFVEDQPHGIALALQVVPLASMGLGHGDFPAIHRHGAEVMLMG